MTVASLPTLELRLRSILIYRGSRRRLIFALTVCPVILTKIGPCLVVLFQRTRRVSHLITVSVILTQIANR